MKLSTKVITLLFISYLTITLVIYFLSLSNLKTSMKDSIEIFKHELIEDNFNNVDREAEFFFNLLENKRRIEDLSLNELLGLIKDVNPKMENMIIIDVKNPDKYKAFQNSEFLLLLTQEVINKYWNEMLLTSNKTFYIDNYDSFINNDIGKVTPVRITLRIIENKNLIIGYGKALKISIIRLKYIERKNRKKYSQTIAISIVIFLIITTIAFIIVGLYIHRSIIIPIVNLNKGLNLVKRGKLETRIVPKSPQKRKDELHNLAFSFNGMTKDLKRTRQKLKANINRLKTVIDVRKKVETELLKSRERFRSLVETTNDWIWEIDYDCFYLYTSPGVKDLLGYEIEELIGKQPFDFVLENETEHVSRIFKKLIKSGEAVFGFESTNIHKDGHEVILETNGVPVFNEDFEVIGYRGINRDITKRKQTEMELSRSKEKLKERIEELKKSHKEKKKLNDELSEKNKELERIIYVTSHDLRSPLVNIHGFSRELEFALNELIGILESSKASDEIREKAIPIINDEIPISLNYIKKSIIKMDQLLNGLLQLSRIGTNVLTFTDIDINELISDVLHNFDYEIKNKKIKVEKSHLPPCRGDILQINQLFSNLIDNAIKYLNPEKSGIIRISAKKKKNNIIYCVEDNGVGIPEESKEKIFDLFQRLNPKSISGEGIGLNIVKKIVALHKGKIWIESKEGKGSKFYVSLPELIEKDSQS